MKTYIVKTPCGVENEFEDEDKAIDGKNTHETLCEDCEKGDVEITENGESESEETEESEQSESESQNAAELIAEKTGEPEADFKPDEMDVPEFEDQQIVPEQRGVDTDPLEILPEYMIDEIQGSPSVNQRGYAVLAHQYDIGVCAEIVQFPWENEENRAVCLATAEKDGKTYSGIGTASIDDGDDEENIIELSETRALKRALKWASGVGIVGYQELTGQLEEEV